MTKQFSKQMSFKNELFSPGEAQSSDERVRGGQRLDPRNLASGLSKKLPPESSGQVSGLQKRILHLQPRR